MMTSTNLSKEFIDLVKSIGDTKSKQEEDRIITRELDLLKQRMAGRQVTPRKMREYLIRMLYVEMLGHDASFGHIHAVKLTHGTKMNEKRVGYLAVSICLHPEHELMLLLVNTLQHDLKSSNQLEVAMALVVVTKLINKDFMQALLPLIIKAMDHSEPNVRKKAVMTLHRCYQISPDDVLPHLQRIHRVLCDKEPSVMGASMSFFFHLAQKLPEQCSELVPSFVSILKQIIEHRLPREYDYRRTPAPWIQIKMLQILGCLGKGNRRTSEQMYEILAEAIRKADSGINIGNALVYECVRTITTIFPNRDLIAEAAKFVSRFIESDYHNRKYLGIDALASIVQVNADFATEHQLVVIDCLDDPDETLRRKTLDLLYRMTNSHNICVIVENMIRFLKTTTDTFLRRDLVSRITQLADRFSPDNSWYINTLNTVFELGGELVPEEVEHNVMRLIAEGADDDDDDNDDDANHSIQQYAVDIYYNALMMMTKTLPDIMLHVIAWVLGEFGHFSQEVSINQIVEQLCLLISLTTIKDETRCWIMSALMKLVSHINKVPQSVLRIVDTYQRSVHVGLQQQAHEFLELCRTPRIMKQVLPRGSAAQDVSIDALLPCLDDYVAVAITNGARKYGAHNDIDAVDDDSVALNFTPYSDPNSLDTVSMRVPFNTHTSSVAVTNSNNNNTLQNTSKQHDESELRLSGVTKKWGPTGYNVSTTSTFESSSASSTSSSSHPPPASSSSHPSSSSSSHPPSSSSSHPPSSSSSCAITDKEKRAAALFGSLTVTSSSSTTPQTHTPSSRFVNHTITQEISSPLINVVTASNENDSDNHDIDLLALSSAFSSPVTNAAETHTQNNSVDLIDFASLVSSPVADTDSNNAFADNISSTSATTNVVTPGVLDVFDGLNMSEDFKSSEPFTLLDGDNVDTTNDCVSGLNSVSLELKQRLESVSHSQETQILLDAILCVSYLFVYAPHQPIVCIFIRNLSGSSVRNLCLTISSLTDIILAYDGDPPLSVNENVVTVPEICGNTTITVMISMKPMQAQRIMANDEMSINASYIDPIARGSHIVKLIVPFCFKHFLRPASMTTEQFGASWQQPSCITGEFRTQIPTSASSSENIVSLIEAHNIFGVKTIGQENIAAANLSIGNQVLTILLHLNFSPSVVQLIVRSPDEIVSKSVVDMLRTALQ